MREFFQDRGTTTQGPGFSPQDARDLRDEVYSQAEEISRLAAAADFLFDLERISHVCPIEWKTSSSTAKSGLALPSSELSEPRDPDREKSRRTESDPRPRRRFSQMHSRAAESVAEHAGSLSRVKTLHDPGKRPPQPLPVSRPPAPPCFGSSSGRSTLSGHAGRFPRCPTPSGFLSTSGVSQSPIRPLSRRHPRGCRRRPLRSSEAGAGGPTPVPPSGEVRVIQGPMGFFIYTNEIDTRCVPSRCTNVPSRCTNVPSRCTNVPSTGSHTEYLPAIPLSFYFTSQVNNAILVQPFKTRVVPKNDASDLFP